MGASGKDPTGRVRVAVRLRPMTPAERAEAGDDAPACVEMSPETRKVILRKTAWDGETYQFDTVFAETSSQVRP